MTPKQLRSDEMSHIVKGKVQVAYKDKELLLKALEELASLLKTKSYTAWALATPSRNTRLF